MNKPCRISLCFLGALAVSTAGLVAHEVWIEDTPEGQLVVRFAEYGDDFEKSPGALDALGLPVAFAYDAESKPKPFATEKKADHFLIATASPADAAHIETGFGVMARGGAPGRKPFFYARWQPAGGGAAAPALIFDLVPTGKPGEARVTLRSAPLKGAKATAYLPDATDLELTADEEGLVRVPVEKPGLYLLVCKHQREPQVGFASGRRYEEVSHNCSLSWRVAEKQP